MASSLTTSRILATAAAAVLAASALFSNTGVADAAIGGRIYEEYLGAAAANGQSPEQFFGPELTDELNAARGGRWQNFANDSAIYWHPNIAGGYAQSVGGAIRTAWGYSNGQPAGYENGSLGYPVTREHWAGVSGASGIKGRVNHFEGGSVYWTGKYGAHVVWGLIRSEWNNAGAELGRYGFPVGQEREIAPGRWSQQFEGGAVTIEVAATAPTPAPAPTPEPEPVPVIPVPADVYYPNCNAVRAAGADPLYFGDPGYRSGLDRDGDGIACE